MNCSAMQKGTLVLALSVAVTHAAYANEWRPMSSERLVKLPAPVMAKALQQDFRQSALADSLHGSRASLGSIRTALKQLTRDLAAAEDEAAMDINYRLLQQKSAYLDEMETHQTLQQQAIASKVKIYNQLLQTLQQDRQRADDPVSRQVRQAQLAARARMQSQREVVDDSLFPPAAGQASHYTREYQSNLDKIKQLQASIRQHDANKSALLDGVEVSREAFVRHLLAEAEADLALLEQENEMLGTMARLVALDAQALQIQVAYGPDMEEAVKVDERKPRNMVQFFIN